MESNTLPQKWEVPADLGRERFKLMSVFGHGDQRGSNVREIQAHFADHFLWHASRKCNLPQVLVVEDVYGGEELSSNVNLSSHQTPIKVVARLKEEQKLGKEGFLRVDGGHNYFICPARYRHDNNKLDQVTLRVVRLTYKDGWRVQNTEFMGSEHVFEGQCQVLLSVY